MNYEQEIDRDYRSECLYSQQVPMFTHGHVRVKADALGKMILPSKDTLENVIRIHSVQTFLSDTVKATDKHRNKNHSAKLNFHLIRFALYSF
jgi:hypothetical protein